MSGTLDSLLSGVLLNERINMGKDKKKKKEKGLTIDSFQNEYNEALEMLKAKNMQADGFLKELKLKLKEIEDLKAELLTAIETNKKITQDMS